MYSQHTRLTEIFSLNQNQMLLFIIEQGDHGGWKGWKSWKIKILKNFSIVF